MFISILLSSSLIFFVGLGLYLKEILGVKKLKDYRFSFAMENDCYESYFTEKLHDCLLTGTMPIYLGAPNIGDFYNLDGIVIMDKNANGGDGGGGNSGNGGTVQTIRIEQLPLKIIAADIPDTLDPKKDKPTA